MNNAVHEYYTRQEKHFHVPLCKSVQKSKCLKCSGVKIYNYMIEHMNYNCSFVSFKYVLKRYLLWNYMALLLVALWFYFTLWLRCICISAWIYVILSIFVIEEIYVVMASTHHSLECLYMPPNITKIYEYNMHLLIDMISYVFHISAVIFRHQ